MKTLGIHLGMAGGTLYACCPTDEAICTVSQARGHNVSLGLYKASARLGIHTVKPQRFRDISKMQLP